MEFFKNLNSTLTLVIIVTSALIFVCVVLLLFRMWMQGGQFRKDTRIDGKIVIITGANAGIGKETAIDLAKRGGKIYIACRDEKRGENAQMEIIEKSGSDKVHFMQLDLASLQSVREFVQKFHQVESKLHILINNAGVMACPKSYTADGYELQFGTNHLGHFLLTNLLLDLLKAGAPSRIINVSSILHNIGRINKQDLMHQESYWKWLVYGQSKLANILFTRELAKQLDGTGVTVNSLHPGAVNTELSRNLDLCSKFIFHPVKWLVFKTPKSGAQTQIYLAVDPELENVTGKYFADCKEKSPSSAARDDETARWLWKESEKLTNMRNEKAPNISQLLHSRRLKWIRGEEFTSNVRIDGKVVIITGANTGIGKETAIDLAKRGGKIYIACRDPVRGVEALKEIQDLSESSNVYFLQLDLAQLESIRQFSKRFHEKENQLHILINNAGVMACKRAQTRDGFEMQIGVNHMGHFLLTHLLLNTLKESAPARIINVSSLYHIFGYINKNDLNSEKHYWRWLAYAQSKLANILFTRELAKRLDGTNITVNALHPGCVNTELTRNLDWFTRTFVRPCQEFIFKSPSAGAQTQIRLAIDPELENVTGKYFADCKEKTPSRRALNDETAEWLWNISEEWTGMSIPNTVA
ncbi:hypothetical protein PVAND_006780 [Polypedilum vanderplanki]|uniref:Uncharacterized protein n=1 Tax=Polypedilum vanderplanki TaxID=319348 RepID=A0A9J6C512_POLVA|nr:hypothetical protein PVAND_006780 [Polypedilum vanderplanki]